MKAENLVAELKGIQAFYRDWRFSKAGTDDFRAVAPPVMNFGAGRSR